MLQTAVVISPLLLAYAEETWLCHYGILTHFKLKGMSYKRDKLVNTYYEAKLNDNWTYEDIFSSMSEASVGENLRKWADATKKNPSVCKIERSNTEDGTELECPVKLEDKRRSENYWYTYLWTGSKELLQPISKSDLKKLDMIGRTLIWEEYAPWCRSKNATPKRKFEILATRPKDIFDNFEKDWQPRICKYGKVTLTLKDGDGHSADSKYEPSYAEADVVKDFDVDNPNNDEIFKTMLKNTWLKFGENYDMAWAVATKKDPYACQIPSMQNCANKLAHHTEKYTSERNVFYWIGEDEIMLTFFLAEYMPMCSIADPDLLTEIHQREKAARKSAEAK